MNLLDGPEGVIGTRKVEKRKRKGAEQEKETESKKEMGR